MGGSKFASTYFQLKKETGLLIKLAIIYETMLEVIYNIQYNLQFCKSHIHKHFLYLLFITLKQSCKETIISTF